MPRKPIATFVQQITENVRLHLKNIYACGELDEGSTSKESLEVRREGSRNVARRFAYYNLDAIISIGYRVNSIVGVRCLFSPRRGPEHPDLVPRRAAFQLRERTATAGRPAVAGMEGKPAGAGKAERFQ